LTTDPSGNTGAPTSPGISPLSITPPDDSGSDTFARFRYQAYVAAPFALICAIGGDVRSVVLEHVEDIAVEYADRWQFIQVKTRDAGLRRWRMQDLCGDRGGLRALLRGYRAVGQINASHELWLEGGLERGNAAEKLLDPAGRANPAIHADVAHRLGIDETECAGFMARLRVRANLPGRDDIGDRVFRLLSSQAPSVASGAIERMENELIALLCQAMAADLTLGDDWPAVVIRPTRPADVDAKVEAKRVTQEMLSVILGALVRHPQPLLRRFLDTELPTATVLEEKLLAGGATDAVVSDAKQLRFQASLREATKAAASLYEDDSLLEDVRARLQLRVHAALGGATGESRPAVRIWRDLMDVLSTQAHHIDANGMFGQDPDLLLGEICEMSDLCQVDWGLASA
jgi:hypothetical protein